VQKKEASAYNFAKFCEHVGKTPSELLALKEKDMTTNPPQNVVEKLLDDFCGDEKADFTNAEKFNTSIAVKSFFKWNYRDLARASGIVSLEKVKPYNPLTKEILRKLYDRARNPRDRALIPFVTSTGIAKETLSKLTWGHLEEGWEAKELPCIQIAPELLKGHGVGKYKGVRQVTFLTPEAKRALINYREWLEQKSGRKIESTQHMWLSIYEPFEALDYQVLGITVNRLAKEAGVKFSLHDGRRWVTTALEQIGISLNWARKIRGRKVKGEEAPYSQPQIEQLRAKFREAVPLLEFTSEASSTVDERLKAVEKIMQDMTPEQREIMQRHGIKVFSKTEAAKRKERKEKECKDGEHCGEDFKQIQESDLLGYLKEGYEIVHKLANGDLIMKSL